MGALGEAPPLFLRDVPGSRSWPKSEFKIMNFARKKLNRV
jgi:hypothetical protein